MRHLSISMDGEMPTSCRMTSKQESYVNKLEALCSFLLEHYEYNILSMSFADCSSNEVEDISEKTIALKEIDVDFMRVLGKVNAAFIERLNEVVGKDTNLVLGDYITLADFDRSVVDEITRDFIPEYHVLEIHPRGLDKRHERSKGNSVFGLWVNTYYEDSSESMLIDVDDYCKII